MIARSKWTQALTVMGKGPDVVECDVSRTENVRMVSNILSSFCRKWHVHLCSDVFWTGSFMIRIQTPRSRLMRNHTAPVLR